MTELLSSRFPENEKLLKELSKDYSSKAHDQLYHLAEKYLELYRKQTEINLEFLSKCSN